MTNEVTTGLSHLRKVPATLDAAASPEGADGREAAAAGRLTAATDITPATAAARATTRVRRGRSLRMLVRTGCAMWELPGCRRWRQRMSGLPAGPANRRTRQRPLAADPSRY